jgi:transmembrane sensor
MSYERGQLELPKLKLSWDARRTERLLGRVHQRLERRARIVRGAVAITTLASVVCVGGLALRWRRLHAGTSAPTEVAQEVVSPASIKLHEGSEIALGSPQSEVQVVEESPSHVLVDVVRGSGRYSVVPNHDRTFEVRSGPVTVTVVGTEFSVDKRPEGTSVQVFRGRVRVNYGSEQSFLSAGESGTFPRSASQDAPLAANTPPEAAAVGEGEPSPVRSAQVTQVYRTRVARHDYRGAYAVLSRNPGLAGDTVEELLVAADVARLSDHPSEALPYLHRVVREHPHDERAPLAAFTLGRTLSGIGRTQEAMAMFGRVRTSWPQSPLAEDALVRQAEIASQTGDLTAARRIAEQYDRDYPSGRRRAEVRRYARLD